MQYGSGARRPAPVFGVCPASAGYYNRRMTDAIAFDTHRFVKRLTGSGFTEEQAETLAEEHVALLNSNLATKIDIEMLRQGKKTDIEARRQDIRADIDAFRQEMKANMESLKADLLKWLFGALIAQGSLIVALIKLL